MVLTESHGFVLCFPLFSCHYFLLSSRNYSLPSTVTKKFSVKPQKKPGCQVNAPPRTVQQERYPIGLNSRFWFNLMHAAEPITTSAEPLWASQQNFEATISTKYKRFYSFIFLLLWSVQCDQEPKRNRHTTSGIVEILLTSGSSSSGL